MMKKLVLLIGCIVFLMSCDEENSSRKTYMLLSAIQPGQNPELFGLDLVSMPGRHEYAMSISPTGDEVLFSAETPDSGVSQILYSRFVDGKWTVPEVMNLTPDPTDGEMEASFSPDGDEIFFTRYDSTDWGKIYMVSRTDSGWSKPVSADSTINSNVVFYPTIADDGTIYYTNVDEKKIYKAEPDSTGYSAAVALDLPFGVHSFISPDEDFMLFDFEGDIYISYREDDGWGVPEKLNEYINTEFSETCPTLSPDGKYLFFSRYNEPNNVSNIYWVKADFIKDP